MFYKNFKTVTYCVARWVNQVTEEQLRKDADFLQKYVKIDKIYLESNRDEFATREKVEMVKTVMDEYGIEVSGGITTVTPNLNEEDKKRQRLFNTFCYCNEPMRARLKEISEYTASLFDEFIIDTDRPDCGAVNAHCVSVHTVHRSSDYRNGLQQYIDIADVGHIVHNN